MAQHNTPTSVATSGAFKGLKTPRELLNYNLMRGVTDLVIFNSGIYMKKDIHSFV